MKGIEKEVDRLGRVVIPSEYRKRLGIKEGSKIVFSSFDRGIYLEPIEEICALCGESLRSGVPFLLCDTCIADIAKKGLL
jgi:AbrB family looped-hinge helix DNA binding protein